MKFIESKNKKFKAVFSNTSRDNRTNEWKITCNKCNKKYTPPTTMYRFQELMCPKCSETDVIDYNI